MRRVVCLQICVFKRDLRIHVNLSLTYLSAGHLSQNTRQILANSTGSPLRLNFFFFFLLILPHSRSTPPVSFSFHWCLSLPFGRVLGFLGTFIYFYGRCREKDVSSPENQLHYPIKLYERRRERVARACRRERASSAV